MSETLTTGEAAKALGVTPARIRQMVLSGQLPATKFGRDLAIRREDLKLVEARPSAGRPPKDKPEQTPQPTRKAPKKAK